MSEVEPVATNVSKRQAPLDGMRAAFLFVIMAHHLVWAAPTWADGWVPGAWTALDGFFVLSGFLITRILLTEIDRTGTIRYGRFLFRRVLRLYPAMLGAIALMATVSLTLDDVPWRTLWPTVRAAVLYVMNIPFGRNDPLGFEYTHLWSLAVEFHFYLLLPLFLMLLAVLRIPRWSWGVVIGVVMTAVWIRRVQVWDGAESFPGAYVFTDTRADALLWGVLVALALKEGWINHAHRLWARWLMVPVAVWSVYVMWQIDARDDFTYWWGMTLSGLCNAIFLVWILLDSTTFATRLLGSRPMAWLGVRSYSMYLYHYPVYFFAARHLTDLSEQARAAASIAIILVLSDLSYRLIEVPGFRLKDRLSSRTSRRATANA